MSGGVRAAGGVLWRPTPAGGVEVAVVHRPRYDDWSLPKGKLEAGEHAVLGALREVREETGFDGVPGRTLGSSAYTVLVDGRETPKRVRWWAVRAAEGEFVPGDEVDELRWLGPAEAARLLTAGRDAAPLALLAAAGTGTATVLLVRHARAGDRSRWRGPDDERPLDPRGCRQADALAGLLRAWRPAAAVSAPPVRCRQTVAPLGLPVQVDPAFGDQADVVAAVDRLRALARPDTAVVVSSQGGLVPGVVQALSDEAGLDLADVAARKGSLWALALRDGRLVDADHTPPLA